MPPAATACAARFETIASAISLSLADDGATLALRDAPPSPIAIADDELGASAEPQGAARRLIERQAAGALPDVVAITHYERARDYQVGLQRARRGGPGRRVEEIDLPAVLDADGAKTAAERRLADIWARRALLRVDLPWRWLDLRPGDAVSAGGMIGRVARWSLENMVLRIEASGGAAAPIAATASAGRPTREEDVPHGPTRLVLLDLPPLSADASTVPRLAVAAAGALPGWRRAALIHTSNGGASWSDAGLTGAPAVIGAAVTVLPPGDAACSTGSTASRSSWPMMRCCWKGATMMRWSAGPMRPCWVMS